MLLRDDDDEDDIQRDFILEQYLPFRMAVLASLMSEGFFKRSQKEYDISVAEWRVLANLGHLEPQSAHQISAYAVLDKVQVSRAVSRLENKGWVERQNDTQDKRRNLLKLTQKGRQVFGALGKRARTFEDDVCASLSVEEYAALDRILHKLRRRAEALT